MAENLTQNQIITIAGRKKMLRARAGEIQLPKIVGFVFGDGGVDADGNVIAPLEAESELKNELLRKKYDTSMTFPAFKSCSFNSLITASDAALLSVLFATVPSVLTNPLASRALALSSESTRFTTFALFNSISLMVYSFPPWANSSFTLTKHCSTLRAGIQISWNLR